MLTNLGHYVMRCAAIFLAAIIACAAAKAADNTTNVTQKMFSALALVITPTANGNAFGTAFCVYSNSQHSYFITNKHVIADATGDTLLHPANSGDTILKARVYPNKYPGESTDFRFTMNPKDDLAVLVADIENYPAVVLSDAKVLPGTAIGIAGYPDYRLKLNENRLQEIENIFPSVHFGHTNAVETMGYMEIDALVDHGNSGGPMFDQNTGVIYGVVVGVVPTRTELKAVQNNLAIPIQKTKEFLTHAMLPYHSDTGPNVLLLSCDNGKIKSPIITDERTSKNEQVWCTWPDAPRGHQAPPSSDNVAPQVFRDLPNAR
jgi:S1-C subfamily serine protease